MASDEYVCAVCRGTFKKGWTDEEAKDELDEVFGLIPIDVCEIVCDDCYKNMGFG